MADDRGAVEERILGGTTARRGDAVFVRGLEGWSKLNSVYGICRWLGADASVAGAAQLALTLTLAAGIVALWRGPAPFARKAAALLTATLLATPYVYIYDFPLLAAALAFLYREKAFDRRGTLLAAIACACVAIFPWAHAATGFLSTLAVAAIICARTLEARSMRVVRVLFAGAQVER